jgi:nicotinamidase-related amidase
LARLGAQRLAALKRSNRTSRRPSVRPRFYSGENAWKCARQKAASHGLEQAEAGLLHERTMSNASIDAEPEPIAVRVERTALLIIDMQRDFLEPGGFGETLGNDVSLLQRAVEPCRALLDEARRRRMLVIHTREGHRPDMSDAPPAKVSRGKPSLQIGSPGPMGRILIRGEPGHDIVAELYPQAGEPVVDKPGKGAFYATDLHSLLQNRGIENLIVCGVTTEVCVHTTVREANDRGYRCIVPSDCCASYFPEFHEIGLRMIKAQGGIFGWVSSSTRILDALGQTTPGRLSSTTEERGS